VTIWCDFVRRRLVLIASVCICLYNKFDKVLKILIRKYRNWAYIHFYIILWTFVNSLLMKFVCYNATWHDSRMWLVRRMKMTRKNEQVNSRATWEKRRKRREALRCTRWRMKFDAENVCNAPRHDAKRSAEIGNRPLDKLIILLTCETWVAPTIAPTTSCADRRRDDHLVYPLLPIDCADDRPVYPLLNSRQNVTRSSIYRQ
jgi:hypothetical protein